MRGKRVIGKRVIGKRVRRKGVRRKRVRGKRVRRKRVRHKGVRRKRNKYILNSYEVKCFTTGGSKLSMIFFTRDCSALLLLQFATQAALYKHCDDVDD